MKRMYRIEPAAKAKFHVVCYETRWFWTRRFYSPPFERLQLAEHALMMALEKEYAVELDHSRFVSLTYSVDDLRARDSEETVYLALVTAGMKPASKGEIWDTREQRDLIERMLDRKFNDLERRAFHNRFMSWYAQHDPAWVDPRSEYDWDMDEMAPKNPLWWRSAGQTTSANSVYRRAAAALSRMMSR